MFGKYKGKILIIIKFGGAWPPKLYVISLEKGRPTNKI
jgi:hypothetical protein